MTRLAACVLAACALAGCGAADERAISTPAPTLDPKLYGPKEASPDVKLPIPLPRLVPPSAAVASALAGGEVGVVGHDGRVGVRPRILETSADGTVGELVWSRWDASGAEGRGELSILDCNPSCAGGPTKKVPATVTLAGVRTCGGRRYFEAAQVRIAPADSPAEGAQPAAYVRAPC
jgi:hypothetical protein